MFVRYYALDMVIMAVAYVIVKKVTKDQSVRFQPMNVKCPAVQHMDDALKANAIVNAAIKDTIARNVSIFQLSHSTHAEYVAPTVATSRKWQKKRETNSSQPTLCIRVG